MPRDAASYRDPAGHVHLIDGKVYRSILPPGVANFRAARDSGFLDAAARDGRLVEGREVDRSVLATEEPHAEIVIEHPRLDFITYPYSWSFYGLRVAALLTLDLHIDALNHGLTLSDASAYNIYFEGPRPVFLDYLSIIRYEEGQVWFGYRQFCEQFLNPLLLTSKTGVAFQPWYRGTLEGIPTTDVVSLLPLRSKLTPLIALHTVLHARLQRSVSAAQTTRAQSIRLSRSALTNNLRSMRGLVSGLRPPSSQNTPWQDYERTAQYSADERATKARFVADVVAATGAKTVWDLGCNTGEYSQVALESGAARVFGFESDAGALNAAFQRAEARHLNFLPLAVDLTNPPPSSGWMERERPGIMQRSNADCVLCLALLHHLVLGRNLPLPEVLGWLVSLAPNGVIEFVPKSDPMAQQLLTWKPAIAPDYELASVRALLQSVARITREELVSSTGRTLLAFSRA